MEDFSDLKLILLFGNSVQWQHSNLKSQICKICFECVREPLMTQEPVLEYRQGRGVTQPWNLSPPSAPQQICQEYDVPSQFVFLSLRNATLRPRSSPRDPPFHSRGDLGDASAAQWPSSMEDALACRPLPTT